MSRRDTIIISVLVNAAILAVLFTTAITRNNSLEEPKMVNKALLEEPKQANNMLASNAESNEENVSKEHVTSEIQKQFIALMEEKETIKKDVLEDKSPVKEEEKIVYKLPEIAKVAQKKTDEKKSEYVFELTIRSGDTLEKIARTNHVKISDITNLNNLPNSLLRIGQRLLIPENTGMQKTNPQRPLEVGEKKTFMPQEFYIVKVGDNPYTIAIKHSIKPNELLKLNNLDEKRARRLKPGDKLRIR
ncbi:MAG: Peptidoglycan endopeptidase LytF [Candidatus Anoxychlamydiales bacterium]|nr:Peptidoglycan endopeptidase LytF [Candidatus Anoxychlamydiales bacterium]